MTRGFLLFLGGALLFAGCGGDGAGTGGTGGSFVSETYSNLANWLCHPSQTDADNVCVRDLDATVVNADGSTNADPFVAATDPEIDCFYVYPTASFDASGNSDLVPNDEEIFIVRNQLARFGQACRIFAPVYRQVTLQVLLGIRPREEVEEGLAYGDVLDSFRHYMANENDGRGVLFIGHSQGSGQLRRLIQEVVEPDPDLHDQMVAAYLIGATIEVPGAPGSVGTFVNTPLCQSDDEIGCVVTYASFRSTVPPEASTTLFGATSDSDTLAACNNPAALGGGPATTTPYFPTNSDDAGVFGTALGDGPGPFADPERTVPTPYYTMPNFLETECVNRDGIVYLEIRVLGDPNDPRADDIGGDFAEGWGMHLADMTVAMGDLVSLAESQGAAYVNGSK